MARDQQRQDAQQEQKPVKKFLVTFKAPPFRGRIENVKTVMHAGANVIDDRDDAIVLLRYPGCAKFRALDAVEAGLVSMGELRFLGYAVPDDVPKVPVKIPGDNTKIPNFLGLPAQERQEWAEKLNIAIPARATLEAQCEVLEVAWRKHFGGT